MEKKLLYTRSETARLLSVSVYTLDALRNDCVILWPEGTLVSTLRPKIWRSSWIVWRWQNVEQRCYHGPVDPGP